MVIRMLVTLLFVECGSFHGDLAEIKRKWKIFSGPIYCSLCYTGLSSPVFFFRKFNLWEQNEVKLGSERL